MTILRLAFAGIQHNRRINLAVLLGVATATAVLTGALLVGDSMRASLRSLVLNRLGRIEQALVADQFFRAELVEQVRAQAALEPDAAEGAMLVQGSLKNQLDSHVVSSVTILGCRETFWKLGQGGPVNSPADGQIVLNARLASPEFLDVGPGDRVVLQIGRPSDIPADSPLGRKTETVRRRAFTVSEVLTAEGLGGFGLSPSQQLPINAFVSLSSLQDMLDADGQLNLILVAGTDRAVPQTVALDGALDDVVPKLADYGLKLQFVPVAGGEVRYHNLTSQSMMIDDAVNQASSGTWSEAMIQPALTYLANWITAGDRRIPYSTVTAIDSVAGIGPLLDTDGNPVPLADDEIVLNDWAATDLAVQPGDEIALTFFDPETTHGQVNERTATFRLKAVVALGGDGQPPTPANDARLTPELKGVTDQQSIDDWDPPFPFDASRVRDLDEDYWNEYRATPKAFVSLATGRRLWASRFGDTTSLRIVPSDKATNRVATHDDAANEALAVDLELQLAEAGLLRFQPIRQYAVRASSGTTPFGLLFLGFSMFLIAAAMMLVILLFRLGVDERADEFGLLFAVGFSRRQVLKLLLIEAIFVAGLGALVGVAGGVGYASLMVTGLRTWWVQAITTPFLQLHIAPLSLVVGYLCGSGACIVAIGWTLWRWRAASVRRLLAGVSEASEASRGNRHWRWWFGTISLMITGILIPLAMTLRGELQAAVFFMAGGSALFGGLVLVSAWMRASGNRSSLAAPLGIARFAVRNMARNPQRSTLTIGLVAAATFVIIAISAFRLEDFDAGGGGFDLLATSAVPLHYDLASDEGRFELGIHDDEAHESIAAATVLSFRVHGGDDASCLNLYQPRQPRVLGVPESMPQDFRWAGSAASWNELAKPLGVDASGRPLVPVVLDQNTAMYSLQLYRGVGETFAIEDASGQAVTLQIVGLLKNSVFQGDVLMAEQQLLRLYPHTDGYGYFLIQTPAGQTAALGVHLENQLADFGFDVVPIRQRMAALFAVQNTYLSTFQSLGGLGLILGLFGLAAVQVRNVVTRRGELAVMRATGFRHRRLAATIVVENICLLTAGLGIGVAAALLAVVPHFLVGSATVPWESLVATLALIVLFGLMAGLWAVRVTVRAPLIPALRGD